MRDSKDLRVAMMGVFMDLQKYRRKEAFFMGKQSSITIRDLLKWASRQSCTKHEFAHDGYSILAERARDPATKQAITNIIQ